ncbi:PilZ domain-containing protein [Thiorhodococcus fuscus]|uniref:PilZ domain-containing protein n=1 Tax=Thiorhodococcus fuscus TaxID=527200 RepID=A0ABW4Y6U4_9GAMM
MTVEHRYGSHRPADIEVHIEYRKRRFFSARGRNISDQGMYLAVRNLTLPKGTMVTLDFQAGGRDWAVDAIVAHHDAAGISVTFRDPQPDLVQLVRLTELPGQLMGHSGAYAGRIAGA